ncbi:MAG: NusA-like transcription termination signal-binding factor [Candidatus Caldarchaeum sp.]|uniref:Probable transcription termination protein NusA n=1 Tax=Caldiarchaeum subterraneum TaxID=311458 RepID=A0A7J3VTR9_CALS0
MSEGIKLTEKEMKYIQMFETVTGATVVDCVEEGETLTFIVRQGEMRKALSNKGSKIKELVRVFKKRIKVVEFTTDASAFIKNLLYPAEVIDPVKISERPDGRTVAMVTVNPRDKGVAIGKDGKNINLVRLLAKRHFNIDHISIQ